MIGKKINQLATELAPVSTDLTIIGDPISGVSKKITLAQLGAIFSGAVSFYTNLASFPAVGDINVIFCAKDTQKLYLWSGSAYTEVFPSQALLNTYQLRSEKGVSNGYASLDAAGKVPIAQLPSSIMEYKGTWNASTNTPTLANGTGDTGDVYICNVAGTVNFGAGPLTFAVGDYVIYSGSIWQRSSGAVGTVTSVAVSRSGDALAITGSPITTSGTINLGFAGNSTQYINGAGNLVTFPGVINEAQNLITEVYNKTGATLIKGTVVYINGGQGNLPAVTKALATGDSTSAQTYGIVRNDITNNNNGYVVVAGRISDLDTQAYTEGTQLYLSPTTAGTFTSTKQYAPAHLVYIAIVVRAHPTQGVIEVKIQNGYEMDELHNVAAQSPDNNDLLQYKTSTSLWTKVAGTTTNIAEGTNLYYTDVRARASVSLTTTGTSGAATYNSTTGVFNIPQYQASGTYVNSVTASAPLSSSGGVNPNITISQASGSTNGFLSSADWTTFNGKQAALNGTGFVKISGTTISYDNSTYVTTDTFQTISASKTFGVGFSLASAGGTNQLTSFVNTNSIHSGSAGTNIFGFNNSNNIYFGKGLNNGGVITYNNAAVRFYALPDADGTIALVGGAGVGTVTSVGLSSATSGLTIGSTPITTSGTITLAIATASGSQQGLLSSTDWNTFNNKASSASLGNYLPLAGGTLTGALTGTSATFSSSANSVINIDTFPTSAGEAGLRITDSTRLTILARTGSAYTYRGVPANSGFLYSNTRIAFLADNVGGGYTFHTGDSGQILSLASTGAATFSSSVDTNSYIRNTNTGANTAVTIAADGTSHYIQSTNAARTVYNNLLLNPYGANVGIGTTSPAEKLSVAGAIMSTGGITGHGANRTTISQEGANGAFWQSYGADASTVGTFTLRQASSDFSIQRAALTIASTGAATFSSSIQTGAPTNGTAQPWKLGNAVSGGVTTNHYIIVEINGTTYTINALNGLP